MFYSLYFCLCYTLHYTLYITHNLHSWQYTKLSEKTINNIQKFKLFVANNPLRVVASFFPLRRLKSSIPSFSRKIVPIFRRFWLKIVLSRESLRLLYALKLGAKQKNMRSQEVFKKSFQGLKICEERGGVEPPLWINQVVDVYKQGVEKTLFGRMTF